MNVEQILQNYPFFSSLGQNTREEMLEEARTVTLEKNTPYFNEGDTCSSIAFIGTGSVVIYKTGENGRKIVLYRVNPGQTCILSTSCILSAQKLPAYASAESFTEAIIYSPTRFRQWIDNDKSLRSYVFEIITVRFNRIIALIEEIAFGRIDRRLADLLIAKFENSGVPLTSIVATHESIASELGTAREVVSRALKKFESGGAISLSRGRMQLTNESILKSLAEMI